MKRNGNEMLVWLDHEKPMDVSAILKTGQWSGWPPKKKKFPPPPPKKKKKNSNVHTWIKLFPEVR